jgi:hypothetical protein
MLKKSKYLPVARVPFKIVDNDLIRLRLEVAKRIAATPVEALHLAQQATLETRTPSTNTAHQGSVVDLVTSEW